MKQFISILALAMALPLGAMAQVGGVTAEISLDQPQYMPDEDIDVTLQIFNRSGQTIEFGKEPAWITFSVQGEANRVGEHLGDVPAGEFSLVTGQMGTKHLNLASFYSFHQTGHYRVVATIKLPQWNQEIATKEITFAIMNGVPMPGVPELSFGVPSPAGSSNSMPEVRKYMLLKSTVQDEPKVYFRLSDSTGARTIRTYPLGRIVSFAQPEAQVDSASNLHLLYQSYARSFSYYVINPDGKLVSRQTHEFTQSRPTLKADSEGRIYVSGGARRYSSSDWPVPTVTNFQTNTNATNQ